MKKRKSYRSRQEQAELLKQVMLESARMFLEKGYTNTTIRMIAQKVNVSSGALTNLVGVKEDILCELVNFVLEGQFQATEKFLDGITDDKVLFYAAETTLQLYMAESSEHIRDIYANAYSMPKTSAIIQKTITEKLEHIFGDYLPNHSTTDFYKLEIASGGIIRGYMTISCDMWFTMDQKVDSFLETSLKIYDVPKEKIKEAQEFVKRFDYPKLAKEVVESMVQYLDNAAKDENLEERS